MKKAPKTASKAKKASDPVDDLMTGHDETAKASQKEEGVNDASLDSEARREKRYVMFEELMTSIFGHLYDDKFLSLLSLFDCRLIQNRKSAKKCRQKKKELLKNIVGNFGGIQEENI